MAIICVALCAGGFLCPLARAQTNEWTWIRGGDSAPSYGALGTTAATNTPGNRSNAVTWTDSKGNFWFFGGYYGDNFNDLWEFVPSTGEWTWMSGSSVITGFWGQAGVYGTLGQPAAGNVPGGRFGANGWTDSKGNLWLFGGWGCESDATNGFPESCSYNDLWEFNPSTSEWAWMGGSDSTDQPGVYGALGTPSAANVPGGRENAASWTDSKGNFWLFGGYGYDLNGSRVYLNDLWEFNPVSGEWAWVSGSDAADVVAGLSPYYGFNNGQPGVYGALGSPASENTPGGRADPVAWTDAKGILWLFGGYGADSAGVMGYLNDLWKFDPSTSKWTWMGGSSTIGNYSGPLGAYETWMTPAAGNQPGGRQSAAGWTDSTGNFWLYGGRGMDSSGTAGELDDLWEFNPSTNQWAWMGGDSTLIPRGNGEIGQPPVYGVALAPGFVNTPGGRDSAMSWTDKSGNLWFFGGYGFDANGLARQFNDVWEYQPNAGNLPAAATPSLSINTGSYAAGQTLSISDTTPGATIYYINGAGTATQYTETLTISSTETVQALAVASGYANSAVASATYTVPVTATPTFGLPAGSYSTSQRVTIADTTPGAIVYYAINAAPTTSSNVYGGAITVSGTETVEAIAVAPGYADSAIAAASYTIWPASAVNEWAWMGGLNTGAENQVYGTLGMPAAGNIPGARYQASTWIDSSGNFWLFAGFNATQQNDLWKFNPSTSEWAWINGSIATNYWVNPAPFVGQNQSQSGSYGTLGTFSVANVPGDREGAASWTDSSGNFWIFGGEGLDATGTLGILNDVWEFNPSTSEWAWMGGSSAINDSCFLYYSSEYANCAQPGVYGTSGTPATGNIPGSRVGATTWADSKGNIWLFGGWGYDISQQLQYFFNDLWEFNPSTNKWAWMGGNGATLGGYCFIDPDLMYWPDCGQAGVYGAMGTPSASSVPGGRSNATGWVDNNGNLWLYGGWGFDANGNFGNEGYPDDLWEYNTSTNKWTWMGGNSTIPIGCTYLNDECVFSTITGTLGTPAAGNFPGPRFQNSSWKDSSGNFWLFSGAANDLWEFNPSANEWAWMGGSTTLASTGVFGTLGEPASGNNPGKRIAAADWIDSSGNLWLFGGETASSEYDNDLWKFVPSAPAPVPGFAVEDLNYQGFNNVATFTIQAGTTGTTTINTIVAGGFNSPITLSAVGLPSGITASFSPSSITGFGTSTVTFSVGLGVAQGNYTLTVAGSSGNVTETTTVTLTVTAAPPATYTFAASPTSLTIYSGAQGTSTLTVTPQYGFNSAVSFACSGLPANASCSFSPTTVTPSGAAATTQLTIAVSAQAMAVQPRPGPFFPATAIAAAVCMFAFRRRRAVQFGLALAVIFAGMGLLSGCGGGGTGGGGGGGGGGSTPVTSTVTVTATSGSIQQIATLTLTVN